MSQITRRDFIRLAGAAGAVSALGVVGCEKAKPAARVVVIGGGFGGATCARYIRRADSGIEVTLIEQAAKFVTCPFSNTVLGGLNDIDFITHTYDALRDKHGVKVVHDTVTGVDPVAKKVTLKGGGSMSYDRLVVSPGIDLKWGAIEGYDQAAGEVMPHAWQAGPQTLALRKQLEAMDDGGVVIIAAPGNPFRCPPGPYERASLIAHYLKTHKPKSKILILDTKEKFSKMSLFKQGWRELYPDMIEWVAGSVGGKVVRVDTKAMTVITNSGDTHKGNVINIIPPQKAGAIAHTAGLVNEAGWCPVDQKSFESSKHKGIHVIGDSCVAGKMPKSGFSANSQGKVCAAAVVAMLKGESVGGTSYVNTCYSLVGPDYGISVAKVYRWTEKGIVGVEGSGGVTPADAPESFMRDEAKYAKGWYASIMSDMFG